jgi:hypothetical protein
MTRLPVADGVGGRGVRWRQGWVFARQGAPPGPAPLPGIAPNPYRRFSEPVITMLSDDGGSAP